MSGNETKMGGETSRGHYNLPQPAPTAVSKHTGGSDVNYHAADFDAVFCSALSPGFLNGLYSQNDIDSSNSSYIIDISEEEVNYYVTSNTVKEKLKSLDDASVIEPRQPKIEKVPLRLSENTNFHKYYKPRMVSIGPYHHAGPNLNEMEELKLKIVMQFIQKHHLAKEIIYSKIRKEITALREFYEEEAVERFDDDELAWMFFLDGCIILHYIYCATENIKDEGKDEFQIWNIKPDCLTFVKHDLFLLENQIPYRVLELVISCLHNGDKINFRNSIEDFIFDSIKAQWEKHEKLDHEACQNKGPKRLPKHLLDLLRAKILQSDEKSTTSRSIVPQPINYLMEIMSEPLEKIKDLIEYMGKAPENFPSKQARDLQFCRNVEELKAAGIRLKSNDAGCPTDITFNLGTLKIHPIKVDDTTASMFLNLIAYEMTPDFPNDFGISSYIAFLDSLIDRTQDVKELRDRQILRNVLGSDEEVAKLFNEIGTNLVPNPKKYADVKKNIQKRYKNTWMTWIAQLKHQYFRSPWSVIAFLAAVAILTLTVIQTVYTILSYYKKEENPS